MFFDDETTTTLEPTESARERFESPGAFDLSELAGDDLELILGEEIPGTVVVCGPCGEAYLLAEEVTDERLFRVCPGCVHEID